MPVCNQTNIQLPFTGSWLCFWGGDAEKLNHHHSVTAQRYAFDFVKTDDQGDFYKAGKVSNESSYAFGEDVMAPADGIIVEAIDGIPDNLPGNLNTYSILGNYPLIKHRKNEFSVLAHLKQGSVKLLTGDKIRAGQKLAECGNSGYSTDVHLHYHLQNSDVLARIGKDYKKIDVAQGVKIRFKALRYIRAGKTRTIHSFSPIRDDIVQNL